MTIDVVDPPPALYHAGVTLSPPEYCDRSRVRLNPSNGSIRPMTNTPNRAAAACSVPDCPHPVNARALCASHYTAAREARAAATLPVCAWEAGCDRPAVYRKIGLCRKHYQIRRLYGRDHHVRPDVNLNPPDVCRVEGCDMPHRARGLCVAHGVAKWRADNPGRASALAATSSATRRERLADAGVLQVTDRDLRRIVGSPCLACGAPGPSTVDHVIPVARGGRHAVGNLAPLCRSCNSSKGPRLWVEWIARGAERRPR